MGACSLPTINNISLPELRYKADNLFAIDETCVKEILDLIPKYAKEIVQGVDQLIQKREQNGFSNRGGWGYWNCTPRFQYKLANNLYTLRSSNSDGSKEKFSVTCDPSKTILQARWHLDGCLQGDLVWNSTNNQLSFENQGLCPVRVLREMVREGKQSQRVHQILCREAQTLVKLSKTGLKQFTTNTDTEYKIRKKQNQNSVVYSLRCPNDELLVTTELDGTTIINIERNGNNGTKYRFQVMPQAIGDRIEDKAELFLINKQFDSVPDNEAETSLRELFGLGTKTTSSSVISESNGIYRYFVGQERENLIAKHRETLMSLENQANFLDNTGLLYQDPKPTETEPDLLQKLYKSQIIPDGAFSFACANSTVVNGLKDTNGQETILESFGNAGLRAEILETEQQNIINNLQKLRTYLQGLGFNVVCVEKDKEILRWFLKQNASDLAKLGIFIVEDTVYVVDLVERKQWQDQEIKVLKGKQESTLKLRSFPPENPSVATKTINSREDLLKMLENIGFKVANPLEIEEFIGTQTSDSKVKQYLSGRRVNFGSSKAETTYTAQLIIHLVKADLIRTGATEICEVVPTQDKEGKAKGQNYTPFIKFKQGNDTYIAWVKMVKVNKKVYNKKTDELKACAKEHNAKPIIIEITGKNFINRKITYEKDTP